MKKNTWLLVVLLSAVFVYMFNAQAANAKESEALVSITVYSDVPKWVKEQKGEKAIGLNVSHGEYKVTSGATLLAGSQVFMNEEDMLFTPGLLVEVGEGGVTLQETYYKNGAKLKVDNNGKLIEITQ